MSECPRIFTQLFSDPTKHIYMLNAKFDMAALYQAGVHNVCNPIIFDAQVLARLLKNTTINTGMKELARWIGTEKGEVKPWALANGCWHWEECVDDDGNKTKTRAIEYDKIPLEIIQPYAEKDARITYDLCLYILKELKESDDSRLSHQPSILGVLNTELSVTKVLFNMEREGACIDLEYVQQALNAEEVRYKDQLELFKRTTGEPLVNSGKALGPLFEKYGASDSHLFEFTPTGQFSTRDEVISKFSSPLAKIIQEYRDAYKRYSTYFLPYTELVDNKGLIHANFNQCVTTGRMSCRTPNLQNVQKSADKESLYPVRRCFVAPEGYKFVSADYSQIEYRLMLDYAGELPVINKILHDGLDVHAATAEMMGVERTPAKTLGFMLLYGGGIDKLAAALNISKDEAKRLKSLYFEKLPKTSQFISKVIRESETRRKLFNWAGRVLRCDDTKLAYKMPNHLIQSGAADIMKQALVAVDSRLHGMKSKLIMSVHDEFDFYIHESELDVIEDIRKLMIDVYPYKHLPMDVSVSIGSNWAELD